MIEYKTFQEKKSLDLIKKVLENPNTLLEILGLNNLKIIDINQTDGARFTLDNDEIVHLRPSGNAPELRCYVETDKQGVSDKLVKQTLTSISQ